MNVELLIHAIVRQTTLLIAQLATGGGVRAPLSQVADQVFLDLVTELERQGVSRKVSADMFGMGLRSYRRKIQRLSESSTERGRSLWEAVLEHVRGNGPVSRLDLLARFARDDEAQVRAVLHDLVESQLLFAEGSGSACSYRAASDAELVALRDQAKGEGADELLLALMYREGELSARELAARLQAEPQAIEGQLARLADSGQMTRVVRDGEARFEVSHLLIPLGTSVGWEAAVFDHFKAMVTTVMQRARNASAPAEASAKVGGSTYTIDVWDGHPLSDEVYGTLGRLRGELSDLRSRVQNYNRDTTPPEAYTRAVVYFGQSVTDEEHEGVE
jgi:DNA-binding MarR family transcriptional regulator